jgi:hypothetical protein
MSQSTRRHIDVKNLCSRKLYELYASRTVDAASLDAIIDELQTRRHYLTELERLQSQRATRH